MKLTTIQLEKINQIKGTFNRIKRYHIHLDQTEIVRGIRDRPSLITDDIMLAEQSFIWLMEEIQYAK